MSQELSAYINGLAAEGSPDGAADYVLLYDGSGSVLKRLLLNNASPNSIAKTLLNAKGDIIVASADDTPGVLAAGTDGHVLTRDSAQSLGVKWAALSGASGIPVGIIDGKGDLIVGTADDTPARFPVGTNGKVLRANSAQSSGVEWEVPGGPVTSITDSATPTPPAENRQFNVTALAQAASFQIPSGTAVDSHKLVLRIKDNGTGRALTFNAIYRAVGVTLPTTTVANKTTYIGLIYNGADSKWDVVAVVTQV